MRAEQMKQKAAELAEWVESDPLPGFRGLFGEIGEILRAVAGGVIGEYEPDVVLLHDETPTDWPVGCGALVIQGGADD